MSSHITSDLDKISDYIAFIHDGELLFTKTYDEFPGKLRRLKLWTADL